jgi:hypothetical protein
MNHADATPSHEQLAADLLVSGTILAVVLPQLYKSINDMLDHSASLPKQTVLTARGLLPNQYHNSFAGLSKGKK